MNFSKLSNVDKGNTNVIIDNINKDGNVIDPKRVFYYSRDFTYSEKLYEIISMNVTEFRRTTYGHIKHKLSDIVWIIFICVFAGCTNVKEMYFYAVDNLNLFRLVIPLENGIPSYHTILRTLSRVDPQQIAACRDKWLDLLPKLPFEDVLKPPPLNGEPVSVLAQDGKKINGSGCKTQQQKSTHVVTSVNSCSGRVVAEVTVDSKSNEITANPALIRSIGDMSNTVTTFDAMGCQKDLIYVITESGGHITVQIKSNQRRLFDEVKAGFEYRFIYEELVSYLHSKYYFVNRFLTYTNDMKYFKNLKDLGDIKSVARLRCEGYRDGALFSENHYYINTYDDKDVFLFCISRHWAAIETGIHRYLDKDFGEDKCKVRTGNAPFVLNIIRKAAISLNKRALRNPDNKNLSMKTILCKINRDFGVIESIASTGTVA